jgi:DNA-binding response OmpR family regulator
VAILVVDDDSRLRKALRRVLVSHGFQVDVAADGSEALARLKTDPFDLLVLDVMMPGPDGIDLCEELRASGDYMPVLMLTARDAIRDRVTGLEAGAMIYERVWGYDASLSSNSLDVFVGHLRRKLEAGGERRLIHTLRGVGFTLRER